jgi:deoxycytidylate deaminase
MKDIAINATYETRSGLVVTILGPLHEDGVGQSLSRPREGSKPVPGWWVAIGPSGPLRVSSKDLVRMFPAPPLPWLLAAGGMSRCKKSQRAAVLMPRETGKVYIGWNGPALGACDGSEACRRDCPRICIHAEQDALRQAGVDASGGEMFHLKVEGSGTAMPSGPPSCVECSKLMLAAGVAGVWLLQRKLGGELAWGRWTAEAFHRQTLINLGLHGGTP